VTAEAPAGRTGDSGSEVEVCKCGHGILTHYNVTSYCSVGWDPPQWPKCICQEYRRAPQPEPQRTAEERLAAVLALHVGEPDCYCRTCVLPGGYGREPWPCPTARAAGAS